MKRIMISLMVVFCITCWAFSLKANAQASLVGLPVETIVADLSTEIKDIISQLEYSADVTSFRVRSDLLLLLDHLDYAANKLTGKVFDEISDAEKQFFNDVRLTLNKTDELLESNIGRMEELVASLGGELGRLPFVDETPLVRRFEPPFHVSDGNRLVVEALGSRLGAEKPRMEMSGEPCRLISNTEQKAEFACEIPAKSSKTTPKYAQVEAWFFEERKWWQFFGADSRQYTHEVRILPPIVAKYEFAYSYETENTVTKNRSQSNSHKNPHCVGARNINWRYNVSGPNCQIDVGSVKVSTGWKSSNSHVNGPQNITTSGFNVTGSAQNNGSCGPKLFGSRAGKDGRGGFGITANWSETCVERQLVDVPVVKGCLRWNHDLELATPESTIKRWAVNLTLLDGSTRNVSEEEDLGIVRVVRPNDGAVVLKPQSDELPAWNTSFSAECDHNIDLLAN